MNVATAARQMTITKMKPHIGAVVTGIDLREPLDEATQRQLYEAVVDNVVLVMRWASRKHYQTYRDWREANGDVQRFADMTVSGISTRSMRPLASTVQVKVAPSAVTKTARGPPSALRYTTAAGFVGSVEGR